jgi:hypothetical protein
VSKIGRARERTPVVEALRDISKESDEYVLIVGSHPAADALRSVLDSVAPVVTCSGERGGECPAVLLKPCPLRDKARAKVIFFAGEHEFFTPGRWDCMTGCSSPSVAVVEGMDFSARRHDDLAFVGSERGAIGILVALGSVLEPQAQVRS